jgi:two-component system LytT family response regulator
LEQKTGQALIRVVIVEDNLHDAGNLADMLRTHFPGLELLTVLHTYADAVQQLPLLQPDLLFLDINLPGNYTAFDILRACAPLEFNLIFTTAFDKYAIEAIRAAALDYLLKPFDLGALSAAIKRGLHKIHTATPVTKQPGQQLDEIQRRLSNRQEKVMIHTGGNILFVSPEEIIRIEASGAYSIFVLGEGQKITASRNLQCYEDELNSTVFFRTHRSFLVNIAHIKKLKRNSNGGLLTLSDQTEINITKEKIDQLLQLFAAEQL